MIFYWNYSIPMSYANSLTYDRQNLPVLLERSLELAEEYAYFPIQIERDIQIIHSSENHHLLLSHNQDKSFFEYLLLCILFLDHLNKNKNISSRTK